MDFLPNFTKIYQFRNILLVGGHKQTDGQTLLWSHKPNIPFGESKLFKMGFSQYNANQFPGNDSKFNA
jgi:hypothetical protein